MVLTNQSQRGGVIVILFVAVALFAALSVEWSRSFQGGKAALDIIRAEEAKGIAINSTECATTMGAALKRLKARQCPRVSFAPDGSNPAAPDGACSVFHPAGGGAKHCPSLAGWCEANRAELQDGEACGGLIYVGTLQGVRLYTGLVDNGVTSYNHGEPPLPADQMYVAKDVYNGPTNTNSLIAATIGGPYNAAVLCRSIGPEWYLPATQEVKFLMKNRKLNDLSGTIKENEYYWQSNFINPALACAGQATDSYAMWSSCLGRPKEQLMNVRCFRR